MSCFQFPYRVRLADTDAAGVVYFADLLRIAHTAYEQALIEWGINLKEWLQQGTIAIPITHAEIDCFRPVNWGDLLVIHLTPHILSETEFQIRYHFIRDREETVLAQGITQHVSIHPKTRQRQAIPLKLYEKLQQQ